MQLQVMYESGDAQEIHAHRRPTVRFEMEGTTAVLDYRSPLASDELVNRVASEVEQLPFVQGVDYE